MSEKRLANSSFEGVTFTGSFKDVNDHETDYSLCKELLRKTNNIVNNKER